MPRLTASHGSKACSAKQKFIRAFEQHRCQLRSAVRTSLRAASCTPAAMRRLRWAAVLAALACADAGARDAWQASLQARPRDRPPPRSPTWDKSFRCVYNGKNATKRAYAVVLGPISEERKYAKWVYPILALKAALQKKGSRADVLALLALEEGKEHQRMLPKEEATLRRANVRWRYVPKPRIRGFHMGHYKLWVRDAAYVELLQLG